MMLQLWKVLKEDKKIGESKQDRTRQWGSVNDPQEHVRDMKKEKFLSWKVYP